MVRAGLEIRATKMKVSMVESSCHSFHDPHELSSVQFPNPNFCPKGEVGVNTAFGEAR